MAGWQDSIETESDWRSYLVMDHMVAGPGRCDGGCVLPSKQHSDEHACNFMLLQRPAPIHMQVSTFDKDLQKRQSKLQSRAVSHRIIFTRLTIAIKSDPGLAQ